MTELGNGTTARRRARVLYGAVVLATASVVVALVALQAVTGSPARGAMSQFPLVLRGLVLTLAAAGTVGLRIVRSGLPPCPSGREEEAWWQQHLGRAVALWALPDGIATVGAVLFYLSADTLVLLLAVGWAGVMFVAYAPGRLMTPEPVRRWSNEERR